MSAYQVNKVHIDALVTAGLSFRPGRHDGPLHWYHEDETHVLNDGTAGQVGAMLWAENARSVNHRYSEDEWEEPYEHSHLQGRVDPVVVLAALVCYRYQSCETPDWPQSEAYAFCQALEASMIRRLPGYDNAPWEITDPNVFREWCHAEWLYRKVER